MARACDARTGLVYVCNPNNPTGTIVSGDELQAFLAQVPASTAVLVDEAYHHFVEAPSYRSALDAIERHPNVIVARTFSKIYGMAGMRLGYSISTRHERGGAARPGRVGQRERGRARGGGREPRGGRAWWRGSARC